MADASARQWPVERQTDHSMAGNVAYKGYEYNYQSRKNRFLPMHFYGYGLGIFISDYGGKLTYEHTGGADGFVTNTCFVPEENLGIAIFTNNDNQEFFELLRYQIFGCLPGFTLS